MNRKVLIPILVFLTLLLFSSSVFAESSECLSNTTARYNISITNYSDSTTFLNVGYNVSCNQNCSTTLNGCRPDEPYQLYYFLGIIVISFVILMFALWVGKRMPMIDFPIYAVLAMFFAFMGGYFDVFNSSYNTIFLAMTFVPLGFFLYSLYDNIRLRRANRAEKRATGR